MPKPVDTNEVARDPRVDAYIAGAGEFAQPVLTALRGAVHAAVPDVTETIKWRMPFFVLHGVILANMAAFKAHCSFGLWGQEAASSLRESGKMGGGAMGSLGRLTSVDDLPPRNDLMRLLRAAAAPVAEGRRTKSIERPARRVAKPEMAVPAALAGALAGSAEATATFQNLPPSCRREYIDWVAGAKREDTRARRVAQTVERLRAGKRMNEEYSAPQP